MRIHKLMNTVYGRVFRGFVIVILMGISASSTSADTEYFAYITNTVDGTVSVIDTGSNTVIATIPVGDLPWGVAATPDGRRVYIGNGISSDVSVIDGLSFNVVATVAVGGRANGVAISPDGTTVYVAITDGLGRVVVIDTASNTVIATVAVGAFAYGIAVHPEGTFVYVANQIGQTVSVIDTTNLSVVATVPIPGPQAVAVNPQGTRVYVSQDRGMAVIDTSNNTLIATVPLSLGCWSIAVDPAGNFVYAVEEGFVAVIDADSNTVLTEVAVGHDTRGVSVSPDGNRVYVANHTDDSVSVIDTTSLSVIATVSVGTRPIAFGQFVSLKRELAVPIDIKPNSFPNSINIGSNGSVPVALLSTTTFDAITVNPSTVTLASAPVRLRGNGTSMSSFQDVNGDGLLDLVIHVSTEALQLSVVDTEAVLEGRTHNGMRIRGTDSVRIVQ
jgi:YVTN family beta-propeller protein